MITLSLWGTGLKVNIMKDTYFCHYINERIYTEDGNAVSIELVKDGVSKTFHVKETFTEVTNLLKGVRT